MTASADPWPAAQLEAPVAPHEATLRSGATVDPGRDPAAPSPVSPIRLIQEA